MQSEKRRGVQLFRAAFLVGRTKCNSRQVKAAPEGRVHRDRYGPKCALSISLPLPNNLIIQVVHIGINSFYRSKPPARESKDLQTLHFIAAFQAYAMCVFFASFFPICRRTVHHQNDSAFLSVFFHKHALLIRLKCALLFLYRIKSEA
jgi:hypothetical protein